MPENTVPSKKVFISLPSHVSILICKKEAGNKDIYYGPMKERPYFPHDHFSAVMFQKKWKGEYQKILGRNIWNSLQWEEMLLISWLF